MLRRPRCCPMMTGEGQLQAIIQNMQGRLKIEDRDDRLY